MAADVNRFEAFSRHELAILAIGMAGNMLAMAATGATRAELADYSADSLPLMNEIAAAIGCEPIPAEYEARLRWLAENEREASAGGGTEQ